MPIIDLEAAVKGFDILLSHDRPEWLELGA
jgi:hypothetical protein